MTKGRTDALAKAQQAKKQKKAGSLIYVSSSGDSNIKTFENPQSYDPEIECTSWASKGCPVLSQAVQLEEVYLSSTRSRDTCMAIQSIGTFHI
jgi:hypothetical protein